MSEKTQADQPHFKCWLCSSDIDEKANRTAETASRNLARAIDILSRQSNTVTPSVMAIREAITFLHQV